MSQTSFFLFLSIGVIGIIFAGILSAIETAMLTITKNSLQDLNNAETKKSAYFEALLENRDAVATNAALFRLVAEMLSTVVIAMTINEALSNLWFGFAISVAISLVIAIVLVRISPRTLGRDHSGTVVQRFSWAIKALLRLNGSLRWLRTSSRGSANAENVIELMVERAQDSAVIDEAESDMIRSVFELGETITREIMVPRTDMVTTGGATPLTKVLNLFVRSGFSRIPVVGDSSDDLLGVVYFKDVVKFLNEPLAGQKTAVDAMRPAFFVPESKLAAELFKELKRRNSHIAIVVDEYGGIAGLVTIEDIVEEIVGDLTDEHDRLPVEPYELTPGLYRVPARLGLNELGELFELEIDDDDVDTVAGLLAKQLGRVPLLGARAETKGLILTADSIDGRRKQLATLTVQRAAQPQEIEPET